MVKGNQLYDPNPRGRPITVGTGFKNAAKARKTLRLIRGKPVAYQTQVATTMFYRAKHHPHPTPGMKAAQKVFRKFLTRRVKGDVKGDI
jgi:hypothetical protein